MNRKQRIAPGIQKYALATRVRNFFMRSETEGEAIARFGQARLIKYPDGKLELEGGSREDRGDAREWISLFWHEAVVREGQR